MCCFSSSFSPLRLCLSSVSVFSRSLPLSDSPLVSFFIVNYLYLSPIMPQQKTTTTTNSAPPPPPLPQEHIFAQFVRPPENQRICQVEHVGISRCLWENSAMLGHRSKFPPNWPIQRQVKNKFWKFASSLNSPQRIGESRVFTLPLLDPQNYFYGFFSDSSPKTTLLPESQPKKSHVAPISEIKNSSFSDSIKSPRFAKTHSSDDS